MTHAKHVFFYTYIAQFDHNGAIDDIISPSHVVFCLFVDKSVMNKLDDNL